MITVKYVMTGQRQKLLKRNIALWQTRSFLNALLFFLPIWYTFESQYLSASQLGILYGVTMLISVFAEIPTGIVADVLGRRRSVILGFVAQGLAWIVVGSVQTSTYLWIGYILWALSAALISGALTALDYDTLKELKKEDKFAFWMSRAGILESIALLVSTAIGGYIFVWWMRSPYYGVAFCSLLAAGVTYMSIEPAGGSVGVSFREFLKESKKVLRYIWNHPYNRFFAGVYVFIASFSFSFIYVFALVYSTSLIPDAGTRGVVMGGIVFLSALMTNLFAIRLSKNKRLTIVLEILGIIVGYLGLGLGYSGFSLIWLLLLYLSSSFRWAIFDQFANEIMPSEYRATGLSILNMGAGIINFIALILGMYLISTVGQQKTFTGIGFIALFVGSYFYIKMKYIFKD